MPKKRIPSYRLHRPSGKAVVTLSGKDFYLGQYNSKASWDEYQRLIGEYVANNCKLPPTRLQKEISCEDLVLQFMDWAAGYYLDEDGNPTPTVEQCRMALAPVVRFYGGNGIGEFGPLSLKFIREKMIEERYIVKRRIDGKQVDQRVEYTRETINSRINIIRQAFRWGVENEIVPPDVSHALDAVAKLKKGRTAAKDHAPVAG